MNNNNLGFGTSGLMGSAFSNKGRVRLLENCFDLGIKHYDTAPLYGRGEAETVLGKFLKSKADEVTVTTKFGLPPNEIPLLLKPIKPLARFVNRKLIQAKNRLNVTRTSNLIESRKPKNDLAKSSDRTLPEISSFSIDTIDKELEVSLRKLQRESVDFYLFHECRACDISHELIAKLESLKKAGKLKEYGIATGNHVSSNILHNYPDFKGIIQSPYQPSMNKWLPKQRALFLHSVFNNSQFRDLISSTVLNHSLLADALNELAIPISVEALPVLISMHRTMRMYSPEKLIFSSSKLEHVEQVVSSSTCLNFHQSIDKLIDHLSL